MSDEAAGSGQPQSGSANQDEPTTSAGTTNVPVHSGHEPPGFVAPSSYLRPSRAQSRPVTPAKQMNPLDKEQIEGLVSLPPAATTASLITPTWYMLVR